MEYVTLGQVINVRGLKGELKLKSFTDFASLRYKKGNELLLDNEETNEQLVVHVNKHSSVGEFDFVIFDEISNVDSANKYRSFYVKAPIESLPKLKKNEYYYHDLLGMKVFMDEVEKGEVIKVRDDTAQKQLVVKMKSNKLESVPFVKAFIEEVDVEHKIIKIKHWEGLFNED